MKLYLLKRKEFPGYVKNDAILIRAKSEARARTMAAKDDDDDAEWLFPDQITCEEITLDGNEEIIIVDNTGA